MYNNYGYNQYGNYMQPRTVSQQMPQPIQQIEPIRTGLNGKVVESIEVAKVQDIPLDGSTSYFVISDGSAIVTKQLTMDGTSKTVIYKPIENDKIDVPKYATLDDIKNSIKEIDLSDIDDLKDDIKEIRQELKDLKKKKKDE